MSDEGPEFGELATWLDTQIMPTLREVHLEVRRLQIATVQERDRQHELVDRLDDLREGLGSAAAELRGDGARAMAVRLPVLLGTMNDELRRVNALVLEVQRRREHPE